MTGAPTQYGHPAPDTTMPRRGPARWVRSWFAWAMVLAVLLPVGIMLHAGLNRPVHFDGAMNLQVSQNIAAGRGFVRDYGEVVKFPSEIQTSGYYVLFEALVIRIFGSTQLMFQLGNLLALLGLAVAVAVALSPFRWAQILAPTFVILVIPNVAGLSMGGLGEYVVIALVIGALVLLARVPDPAPDRVWQAPLAAGLLVGTAVTIKFVAIVSVPILALAVAMVVRRCSRRTAVGAVLAVGVGLALPVMAFELYRAVSLGGIHEYLAYWYGQTKDIAYQAGAKGSVAVPQVGILPTGSKHLSLLAAETRLPAGLLLGAILAPFVGLAALAASGAMRRANTSTLAHRRLLIWLATYAGLYLVWWFFITPTEKAWLRRLVIGLVALAIMYVLEVALAVARVRDRTGTGGPAGVNPAGVILAAALLAAGLITMPVALRNLRLIEAGQADFLADAQAAGQWVNQASQGATAYGIGWWSAPVVSLEAGVGLGNLSTVDPCEVGPEDVVVWDYYARGIASPEPALSGYEFELDRTFGNYATMYRIVSLKECP